MNGSLSYINGNPEGINSSQVRIICLRSVLKSLAFLFPQEELLFSYPFNFRAKTISCPRNISVNAFQILPNSFCES